MHKLVIVDVATRFGYEEPRKGETFYFQQEGLQCDKKSRQWRGNILYSVTRSKHEAAKLCPRQYFLHSLVALPFVKHQDFLNYTMLTIIRIPNYPRTRTISCWSRILLVKSFVYCRTIDKNEIAIRNYSIAELKSIQRNRTSRSIISIATRVKSWNAHLAKLSIASQHSRDFHKKVHPYW